MTANHTQQIDRKKAWRSRDIKDKSGLTYQLPDALLTAMDGLLENARKKPVESLTREDFAQPQLSAFMATVLEELQDGKGIVILAGCTRKRYSRGDFSRIFWGLCTHLGRPVSQSVFGELLAHVRHTPENPSNRTYRSTREIRLHNDTTDLIGLMCVQGAKSGGVSSAASALAIHNEILATRPDLLPALYKGFPMYLLGQQLDGQPPLTPYDVPVFCQVNGIVGCRYIRWLLDATVEKTGLKMPPDFVEALDYFDEVARREDICLNYMLEPGEIILNNNYTTLHARTEFEDYDDPELKRDLLRIWLATEHPYPIAPELDPYQQMESGGRGGIAKRRVQTLSAVT